MNVTGLQQFEEYLRSKGLRLTGQRELIAATFLRSRGHIGVEELYRLVRNRQPDIGLTTVYRTLKLLAGAGLAEGRNFKDGFERFEPTVGDEHHDHLVCTGCGRIIEFVNDRIEELQQEVAVNYGFTVSRHTLDIYGLCSDCRR